MADPAQPNTDQPTPVLPYDASHPDHARYQKVYDAVKAGGQWNDAESRNVAAGLYDQLRRNPQMGDFDRIVVGKPDAAVPSVFAMKGSGNPPEAQPWVSVPAAISKTSADQTLAAYAHTPQVGKDGYLIDPDITKKSIPALEKGPLKDINAVVMHRTEGSSAQGAFNSFKTGTGTHFLIDKDGTIYQTASLNEHTQHVGKIRGRCMEEGNCSKEEKAFFDKTGWNPKAIHDHEKAKPYPERFPMNSDSVGIEVVGSYNAKTKTWDAPTPEQTASINKLVGMLQKEYGLNDKDVYKHDAISYKTQGEGADLYVPARTPATPVVQPSGPSR